MGYAHGPLAIMGGGCGAILFAVGLALVGASCKGASESTRAVTNNAPADNDTWNSLSRELAGSPDVIGALRERTPWLWTQLERDRKTAALAGAWGRSVNFDEHARAIIVAPALTAALHQAMGQSVADDSVHAGIQHTYGYLFSTVETPYGYKRERWVSGAIERGMGLPPGLFGAQPREGTLLANITFFLSRSLGRAAPSAPVARAIAEFDYERFAGHPRIRERVPAGEPSWELLTHLLRFQNPSAAGHYLLVYEARNAHGAALSANELITAFPISREFAATLMSAHGTDIDIQPRFNAFVPGFGPAPRKGARVCLSCDEAIGSR